MGVEDNRFQIEDLTENTSFFDWAQKTNSEIIEKLNLLKVYDGISGDGINVFVGVTNDTSRGVSSGDMLVEVSDLIQKGVTFADDVTISGVLNYDFSKSFSGVPTVSHSATGATGGPGEGIEVGTVVRYDADLFGSGLGGLTYAKADSPTNAEVFGIALGETGDDRVSVATHGIVNITGADYTLTPGCVHFLDPTEKGRLTASEPQVLGQVSKPVLLATSEVGGLLLNFRGQLLQGTGGTGASNADNNAFFITGAGSDFTRGKAVSFNDGQFEVTNGNNANSMNSVVGIITEDSTTGLSSNVVKIVSNGFVQNSPIADGTGPLFVNALGELVFSNPGSNSKIVAVNMVIGSDFSMVVHPTHDAGSFVPLTGESTGSPIQFSTLAPPNVFGSTSNTGGVSYVNDNELINGSYHVWQRDIGVKTAFTGTGSVYFADKWARVNGLQNKESVSAIQRKTFSTTQTAVEGNPKYFTRVNHSIPTGLTASDFIHVENRVEDSRSFRDENMTLSFYAKAANSGETATAFFKQVYSDSKSTTTNLGTIILSTDFTKYITTFSVPPITEVPGDGDYVAVGLDVKGINGNVDLAQFKLERGLASTPVQPLKIEEEYEKCARYYQRSYAPDITTRTNTTILGTPDATSINFTAIEPDSDFYYRFPVRMRDKPTNVVLFSPFDGATADALNRTAGKNLTKTSGMIGKNNIGRVSPAGTTPIKTEAVTKNGFLIEPISGFVDFDNISVHYIADSDLNINIDTDSTS